MAWTPADETEAAADAFGEAVGAALAGADAGATALDGDEGDAPELPHAAAAAAMTSESTAIWSRGMGDLLGSRWEMELGAWGVAFGPARC